MKYTMNKIQVEKLINCIINHKKLWGWIAEKTLVSKGEYSVWKYDYFTAHPDNIPVNYCFACEAAILLSKHANTSSKINSDIFAKRMCLYCPFQWNDGGYPKCTDIISPYNKWERLRNNEFEYYEEIARYAKEVRDIPLKMEIRKLIRRI